MVRSPNDRDETVDACLRIEINYQARAPRVQVGNVFTAVVELPTPPFWLAYCDDAAGLCGVVRMRKGLGISRCGIGSSSFLYS